MSDVLTENGKVLERVDLVHNSPGFKKEDFFKRIDETGGWPVGWKYVSFFHGDYDSTGKGARWCIFTNHYLNTGWWTTIFNSDDYYWSKLSDEKKAEVTKEARRQLINQLR